METGKQPTVFIMVLTFFIFTGLPAHPQTYSFKYKCTLTSHPGDQKANSDSIKVVAVNSENNFSDVLGLIPFTVNATYDIISDGKYMIVKGSEESSSIENPGITVHSSGDNEAIIDIKGQLIFFPASKTVKKFKLYKLDSTSINSGECSNKTVRDRGADHKVTICKTLPLAIIPPVLFDELKYGIKSISIPGFTIELSAYSKIKKNKRLDECPGYFKKYPVSGIEEGFLGQ